ncbi:type-F conjugative transfer system protein TrbI [Vibrio parahaemolyticus]|nr:type-F conjugative transfer system protein TrbI [Vibrio parahaemolyticus]MCR9653190.1 type-F conjugative transfer system protein TrbI [Vibrio parahaemolyticus]HAS6087878.1 type-F conjugative transfer system protein TrbI [Vibrio vulnificus]
MIRLFQYFIIVTSISAIVSVATFFALNQTQKQTIVSFDVKSTIDTYHQTLIEKGVGLEDQTKRLTRFVNVMNEQVSAYQVENNALVLVSAAVVDGANDITPLIQQAIISRYIESEE